MASAMNTSRRLIEAALLTLALTGMVSSVAVAKRSGGLKDPMQPSGKSMPKPDSEPAKKAELVDPSLNGLQAIRSIEAGQWSAYVNGVWVRVGDPLGDARVVSIEEDEIVLQRGGARSVMKLIANMGTSAQPRKEVP